VVAVFVLVVVGGVLLGGGGGFGLYLTRDVRRGRRARLG
jgi:hypothetical protein